MIPENTRPFRIGDNLVVIQDSEFEAVDTKAAEAKRFWIEETDIHRIISVPEANKTTFASFE